MQCVCLRLSAFEIPYNIDICQLETSQLWLVVWQIKPHVAPRQGQTTTIRITTTTIRITGLWQQNLLRVMTGKGSDKVGRSRLDRNENKHAENRKKRRKKPQSDKMHWQNFTKIIKTCEICSGSAMGRCNTDFEILWPIKKPESLSVFFLPSHSLSQILRQSNSHILLQPHATDSPSLSLPLYSLSLSIRVLIDVSS